MDTKKMTSDYFEALYLKNHKSKKDAERAALLKKLAKGKLHASKSQGKK